MISGTDLRILDQNQEIRFKNGTDIILQMRITELNKILNNLKFMLINNTNKIQIDGKHWKLHLKQGEQIGDPEKDMWSKIENLTENEKKKIKTLLWSIKKHFFYAHGYKNINGAYSDYDIVDYNDGIIFIKVSVGVQDIGDYKSSSEQYSYQFRIKRKSLEILDQFDFKF